MNCSCIYIETEGTPSFVREKLIHSAKTFHKCLECGRTILKGESYYYACGVWENKFHAYKTCVDCESVIRSFFCSGYLIGNIWDDLRTHIWETNGEVSEDCIVPLTVSALYKVCELIENTWEEEDA